MPAVTVGLDPKKKKKKSLEITDTSTLNPRAYTASVGDTSSATNKMTPAQEKQQELDIKRNMVDANKAQEHKEKLENRTSAQKLFGIDPDASFFQNMLSTATFGFTWADDAFHSLFRTIGGDTEAAKEIFNKQWNYNEMTGVMDTISHILSGGKTKTWNDLVNQKMGGKQWAKILGIVPELFLSPTNLALMALTPFTGGASGAAALGKTFSKAAKTAQSLEKGAQGAKEASKFAKGVKLAQETMSVDKIWNVGRKGGQLSAELAANPLVKEVFNYGKQAKWSKNAKQGANIFWNNVGSWSKGAKGFDALDYANKADQFSRGFSKMSKWGNTINEVLGWGLAPGFKAAGAAAKGIGTGTKALANTAGVGSKTARKLVSGMDSLKNNKLFRSAKSLNPETRTAMYQGENFNYNAKKIFQDNIQNVKESVNAASDVIGRKMAGLGAPSEDILNRTLGARDQGGATIGSLSKDIQKNKNFQRFSQERQPFIKASLSNEKGALKGAAKEYSAKGKDLNSYNYKNLQNTTAKAKFQNVQSNKEVVKKFMSENLDYSYKQAETKLLKEGKLLPTDIKVPINPTPLEAEKFSKEAVDWLKKQNITVDNKELDTIFEGLRQSPKYWEKMTRTQKEMVESYLDPMYRAIVGSGEGQFGNKISNFLELKTSAGVPKARTQAKDQIYHNLLNIMEDPSGLQRELKTYYLAGIDKTLDPAKVEQWEKNFSQFYSNPQSMQEVESWLNSNMVRDYTNQYISANINQMVGKGDINIQGLDLANRVLEKGYYESYDTSRLNSYQVQQMSDITAEHYGNNLSASEVKDFYKDSVRTVDNVFDSRMGELRGAMIQDGLPDKLRVKNVQQFSRLSEDYQNIILKNLSPSERKSIEYVQDIQNELRMSKMYGDALNRALYEGLNEVITEPLRRDMLAQQRADFIAENVKTKLETDTKSVREYARDLKKVDADLKSAQSKFRNQAAKIDSATYKNEVDKITKLTEQRDQLQTAIDNLKNATPAQYERSAERIWSENEAERVAQLKKAVRPVSVQDAAAIRGNSIASYRKLGKQIRVDELGQGKLKSVMAKLFNGSPEATDALALMGKENLTGAELTQLADYLGTTEKGVQFLQQEHKISNFAMVSQELAMASGWAATDIPIAALERTTQELSNLSKSAIFTSADLLGIDTNRVAVNDAWLRDIRNVDTYGDQLKMYSGISEPNNKINTQNLKVANEKDYLKTLDTMGMNTNVVRGERVMLTDPIDSIAQQIGMATDDFKVYNLVEKGLKTGDINILNLAEESAFYNYAKEAKGMGAMGSIKTTDSRMVKPNWQEGKTLIKADSLVNSFSGMKYLLKPEEYQKFIDTMVTNIDFAKGAEFAKLPVQDKLKNTLVAIPRGLEPLLKRLNLVTSPKFEKSVGRTLMNAYKTSLGVFKQMALLNPAYNIRNLVSTTFQHYSAGLNPIKSAAARGQAYKDISKWLGAIEPFSRKIVKKGLSHKVYDEWNAVRNSGAILGQAKGFTYGDAADSLLKKGMFSVADHKLAKEMLSMEANQVIGGFQIHGDMGAFANVNNALAGALTRRSLKENPVAYSAKTLWKYTLGGITDANMRMSRWIDDSSRLATYRMGMAEPQLYTRLGLRNAEEFVRHVNLDYSNMTKFEKDVMRNIVPFYSWMRHSVEMHAQNLFKNGTVYGQLQRVLRQQYYNYDNEHPNGIPQWMRLVGYTPLSVENGKLNYTTIMSMPWSGLADVSNLVGDSVRTAANPDLYNRNRLKQNNKNFLGMLNPIIKAGMAAGEGVSSSGGKTNEGRFTKALWNEFGGVFSKIPKLVQEAIDGQNEGEELRTTMAKLLGIYRNVDQESIEAQSVREMIAYLDDEMKRAGVGSYASYQLIKKKMEGTKPKPLKLPEAPKIKLQKKKKRAYEILGEKK